MSTIPRISMAAARVNANLSQQEAAEKLGISRVTLQNYEAGKSVPNWDMVQKIGELYNFPVDYIFFGKHYA